MFGLFLLALTIAASAVVVRLGSIALEMTGMSSEQAGFQALSSYTGVGYTTKEAELAISNPQRRKIIMIMIRLGSWGVITAMATMAGTIVSSRHIVESLVNPSYLEWLPINPNWVILLVITGSLIVLYRLLTQKNTSRLIKDLVKEWFIKQRVVRDVDFEEILVNPSGYGVIHMEVREGNPMVGQSIQQTHLLEINAQVLSVERLGESIVRPSQDFFIENGDRLVCFGPVELIKQQYCVIGPRQETEDVAPVDDKDDPLPVGSMAPTFTLIDQFGDPYPLEDNYGRRHTVMVFYPKDQSFFCSAMLREYKDHLKELEALDTQVIAINPESLESHAAFCKSVVQGGIPILTDRRKKVCKAYRTLMLGGFIVDRTVYVVDKQGIIQFAKRGYPSAQELMAAIRHFPSVNFTETGREVASTL